MLLKRYSAEIDNTFKTIDWKLLLFLVLFLNVKLVVKLAAIFLMYLLQFNFKLDFKIRNSRLPIFYLAVIGIAIFNWILAAGFTNINYTIAFLTGTFFWTLCILAMHQLKLCVEQSSEAVIHRTIIAYFLLNALISISTYVIIVIKTGAINPYLYQGEYQKYFIGTGDYIKGISFDTSTTNAVLNGFGVIYFLSKKNVKMMMLCMIILLMTGSNITNFLLAAVLLLMFIFRTDRDQKSLVFVCLLLLVIFLAKVSPQNNSYVSTYLGNIINSEDKKPTVENLSPITLRPDNTLTAEERNEKIATLYLDSLYRLLNDKENKVIVHPAALVQKTEIPTADINSAPYQHKSIITPVEDNMKQFIQLHSNELTLSTNENYHSKLPGKIIAYKQTFDFFKQNPLKIISGTGTGNFSSKLAFKTTGLNIAGGYPQQFIYINEPFLKHHLDLYLSYFTKPDGFHSIANNPNSVYDQLLSEYGLLGLSAFIIFYLGFFLKNFKKLSYGIPLTFFLSGIFFADYWFEQLSIVVFFELLLFLNMKEEAGK
ncbi:hypothetical protein EFY79_03685 [Hanamia caeni]|uniref:O-antigen polymerase n=1 Tax=Hanamia caeni TaxID=2294116 RepID=A0A3M9NNP1_9BACT|nr:hypothetical protein [Hanamia caeni]RNI38773.1 hypothetical protein EFY79_03685 [Hanamia caeni]